MDYNEFISAMENGQFPREYVKYGLANENRNYYLPDMYKSYLQDPVQPMSNPKISKAYNDYLTRFPHGTDEQFMNLLRRNNPELVRQAQQSITPENLARMARIRNMGKTAANILGKGARALGLAGLALTIPQMAQAYEQNGVAGVAGDVVKGFPQGMVTEGALNFYIPHLNEIRNQQQLGETYLDNYQQLRNLQR